MKLSIIIVNYNTKELLKNCLNSLYLQNKDKSFEIIVVDNNSSDGSQELITRQYPKITLIKNHINSGYGKANNLGAAQANGEYLLFLNSDTLIPENFISNLSTDIQNMKNTGIIGFKIVNGDKTLQPSCGNFPTLTNLLFETLYFDRLFRGLTKFTYKILDARFYNSKQIIDWVSGSCFLIKKSIFFQQKGFDENYFLYVEEVDLCYHLKKSGYTNKYSPEASLKHLDRSSSKNKIPAIILTHHNLIYFFRKNYSSNKAILLKFIFIIKCIILGSVGIILGIFNNSLITKARAYWLLLLTLISKKKFIAYENSLKKQG